MRDPLFFSIVIPTYNEEQDIRRTLEAVTRLSYPHREILVVDDSTDRTPEIVAEYAPRGVRLLHPAVSRGRARARNVGIEAAKGDVVVLLNADVRPEPDFLDRLLSHYERGADYVLVEAQVVNEEALFARFVEAQHHYDEDDAEWINWTEGFSCRREAAIAVGMFPDNLPLDMCAGEDSLFGAALEASGYRKVIDKSIVVFHVTPASFREYWRAREGRGRGQVLLEHYGLQQSMGQLLLRCVARAGFTVFFLGTLIPSLVTAARIAQRSPRGLRDTFRFWWAGALQLLARRWGEWTTLWEIWCIDRSAAAGR